MDGEIAKVMPHECDVVETRDQCAGLVALKVHPTMAGYMEPRRSDGKVNFVGANPMCSGLVDRAIFLVRYPMAAFWSDWQRRKAVAVRGPDGPGDKHVAAIPLKAWRDELKRGWEDDARKKYAVEYAAMWRASSPYGAWLRDHPGPAHTHFLKFERLADPRTRVAALEAALAFARASPRDAAPLADRPLAGAAPPAGMDEEDVLHHQTLLPADMLENSPSKRDGVSAADEYAQRVWGCELIQEAGILLRLPQVVMCTGQNIFQRFYYRVSLKRFDAFLSAMGCFFLACKIEEKPQRLRECLMVFHFVYRLRTKSSATLELGGVRYNGWKHELVKVERHILKELGFSFYIIDHSHKFILFYVKLLDCDGELAQEAWSYLNDCLRTDAALRYRSEVLACAAIYGCWRPAQAPRRLGGAVVGGLPGRGGRGGRGRGGQA
ncbi:hypothetical protein JL721_5993 [Aureococcus anophagefferens]|nr:hypothetical protein JL721_5993 [Aureococcus anophagefferens]